MKRYVLLLREIEDDKPIKEMGIAFTELEVEQSRFSLLHHHVGLLFHHLTHGKVK